jgi:hypothetical protein
MKLTLALVGTKFRGPEIIALVNSLSTGTPLSLEPEPTNKFDSSAVKVITEDGTHIGYVKADQTKKLADHASWPLSATLLHDENTWPMIQVEIEPEPPRADK